MNPITRVKLAIKAARQLGFRQMMPYAEYQLGLRSGHYRRRLKSTLNKLNQVSRNHTYHLQLESEHLPNRQALLEVTGAQISALYEEADEICAGVVRLFGGKPVLLQLAESTSLGDWTSYEAGEKSTGDQDIKFTWEQGRFGWACKLAMAYYLSADERYAQAFWTYTDQFLDANPPYLGPHWSSAQEAAIRLVALSFSIHFFGSSRHTTPERMVKLTDALVAHAERIPPTLVYARSQNNNHLITEALGLYTASALLSNHPLAAGWHAQGKKWLVYAFRTQITRDGTYAQHSTNYHRLMLQCALWAMTVQREYFPGEPFPSDVLLLLQAATRWLWKLVDPDSGKVPNLGHNDGSYILPLTASPFYDYRPVLYAAARAFLTTNLYPAGPWDDMSAWLNISPTARKQADFATWHASSASQERITTSPHLLVHPHKTSWAYFRLASYTSRPAHADQLHLDLWWRGLNLAQDPGTYLYNASYPWENSLTSAFVHNTVTVDGKEFMRRAGRFLYLDWAQATSLTDHSPSDHSDESLSACHDGYRRIGVTHTREVTTHNSGSWEICDKLDGPRGQVHTARLHWLLPDWEYDYIEPQAGANSLVYEILLKSPHGWVMLKIWLDNSPQAARSLQAIRFTLARAGETLVGAGKVSPIVGWTSPTYGDKMPALACIVEATQTLPIVINSEWTFPGEGEGDTHPGPE